MTSADVRQGIANADRFRLLIIAVCTVGVFAYALIRGPGLTWAAVLAAVAALLSNKYLAVQGRATRIRALARRMLPDVAAAAPGSMQCSWGELTPGAFAIGRDGHVALRAACTGYEVEIIERDAICSAKVEKYSEMVAHTRTSGSAGMGVGLGGGIGLGLLGGSTSKTTYSSVERFWVELMWQREINGEPLVCVVPVADRVAGEKIAGAIARLSTRLPKQPWLHDLGQNILPSSERS